MKNLSFLKKHGDYQHLDIHLCLLWLVIEVSVENLLRGIIVASGNDACVALAEGIAGTEEEFAILMTAKAKRNWDGKY